MIIIGFSLNLLIVLLFLGGVFLWKDTQMIKYYHNIKYHTGLRMFCGFLIIIPYALFLLFIVSTFQAQQEKR
jgi:hypothetical protein